MVIHGNESGTYKATQQVKVFAWSPSGHQLFWLRETFYQLLGAMTKMVATCRAAKENKT